MRTFASILIAAFMLCGCADSNKMTTEEAYQRGYNTSGEKQQRMREANEKAFADQQTSMQRFQQQTPSDHSVGEPPVEDPRHTGRPLEEARDLNQR